MCIYSLTNSPSCPRGAEVRGWTGAGLDRCVAVWSSHRTGRSRLPEQRTCSKSLHHAATAKAALILGLCHAR